MFHIKVVRYFFFIISFPKYIKVRVSFYIYDSSILLNLTHHALSILGVINRKLPKNISRSNNIQTFSFVPNITRKKISFLLLVLEFITYYFNLQNLLLCVL